MVNMINQIPESTKRFLSLQNPWFSAPVEIIKEDEKLKELDSQHFQWQPEILDEISYQPGVFVLRGPRQVGKTTVVKLLIKKLLLEKKVPPSSVFYYSCEDLQNFQDLNNLIFSFFDLAGSLPAGKRYIFLDEISFVREWQRSIKSFVESAGGKNIFFFLTGSSTIDLEFSGERLPGRRGAYTRDYLFLPLTFGEFVKLTSPELFPPEEKKQLLILPKLRAKLHQYLLTGGFPKAINNYFKNRNISQSIYELYISWVLGDIHKLNKSDKFLNNLLAVLQKHESSTFSYQSLARESGIISHLTVQDYLAVLEKMFVLFPIDAFSIAEKKPSYKKNHKNYFYDPFIKNCLNASAFGLTENIANYINDQKEEEDYWSKNAENLVASHLKRDSAQLYWGSIGEREVDFVVFKDGSYSYFEVKQSARVEFEDFSYFFTAMPNSRLTVISKNDFWEKKNLKVIPLELFLLKKF